LIGQLSRLRTLAPSPPPPHRIPLGLLMVARGKLTYLEVRAALEAQRRARYGKIGDWIENSVLLRNRKSPPPSPCNGDAPWPRPSIPPRFRAGQHSAAILEAFQMLPINYVASTNTLYLAFGERVDHAALYAIERVLDCRTQPCVAGRRGLPINSTPCANCPGRATLNSAHERPGRNGSHHLQLHRAAKPEQVHLSRIGCFIWLRLNVRSTVRTHLRFGGHCKLVH